MERRKRRSGSADYRAATGVMRDILVKTVNESYEPELRSMRSRVLLVWGELDREVPLSVARSLVEVIGASGAPPELQVLAGVGHLVPTEAPAELRQAIDSLLR
jgi:pimeloyl-ACP methyl ester carboxylesterase